MLAHIHQRWNAFAGLESDIHWTYDGDSAHVKFQALAQATTGSTSKEEQQLAIGLFGCLINITGELEGLKVLMQTEDGKEVLEDKLLGGHLCNRACPCGAWHDALGQCAIC